MATTTDIDRTHTAWKRFRYIIETRLPQIVSSLAAARKHLG